MAFYFVHKGGPFRLGVRIAGRNSAAIIRFYDPEGNLVRWEYIPLNKICTAEVRFGNDASPGIYQIRAAGQNIAVQPFSSPEKLYGFMPLRGHLFQPENKTLSRVYFYVPAGVPELKIDQVNSKITFYNESGAPVPVKKTLKLNLREGQIWSADLSNMIPGKSYFGTDGFPVIYCPDENVARAVKNSLIPYGNKFYAHDFQIQMLKWMSSLKMEDLKIQLKTVKAPEAALPFRFINSVIARQNIDPNLPKFGYSEAMSVMAAAYSLDRPWNPYFKDPILLKRILLAAFRDLLDIHENESYHTDGWHAWGGEWVDRSFTAAQTFALTAPLMQDQSLRALWRNGVTRTADRFVSVHSSNENSYIRWALIFQFLAQGSGEKQYRQIAAHFLLGMLNPENNYSMRTGYFRELGGPDAGLQQRAAADLELYWRMTHSQIALNGLNRMRSFMNHTIAKEPDSSRIYGATNFSHRTTRPWNPSSRRISAENSAKDSMDPASPFYTQFLYPGTRETEPIPAEQRAFQRNFNNEFYALKQNGCYMLIYAGATARGWELDRIPKKGVNPDMDHCWQPTQGISLLWFESYGTFICSKNWNADTGCFVRVDRRPGLAVWPDYLQVKTSAVQNQFIQKSKFRSVKNIEITRFIRMYRGGIAQKILIENTRDTRFHAFYEQLPILVKNKIVPEFFINGKWQNTPGKTDQIRYGKIMIKLNSPRVCSLGPVVSHAGDTIQALRIHFEPKISAGAGDTLIYTITP